MSNVLVEKRKFVRLDYVIPVTVALKENGRKLFLQGFSRNFSYGGMCIEINLATLHGNTQLIDSSEPIDIEVELPHNNPKVHLSGFVRWRQSTYNDTKMLFGIEFCQNTDKVAVNTLYNYAKWERKRRILTKRWFLLSIAGLIGLSIWGVDLSLDNYYLIKRITKLDAMRADMERNLMALRQQKFILDHQLDKAHEENKVLRNDLEQLRTRTSELNATIEGLVNEITSSETARLQAGGEPADMLRLQQLIDQKNELNGYLQQQIESIQAKLEQNEQMLAAIGAKSQEVNSAFYNRFRTKQLLDMEIADLSRKTGMPDIPPPPYLPRSMWVDNQELFKFPDKTDELLDFCTERNINLVFAKIDLATAVTPEQFPIFLKKAHEKGIAVHALFFMSNKRTADRNRKSASAFVSEIVSFNKSQPKESYFDGVAIAISESMGHEQPHEMFTTYLEGIAKLVEGRDKARFPLHIGVKLPYSLTDKELSFQYNGKNRSLSEHILSVADYLTIYEKTADKAVHYASQYGKKVYICQSLYGDGASENYDPSHSGHYIHDMEKSIRRIVEKYLDKPGFMGVAIGSYTDYQKCIEDNTPEYVKNNRQQIISVRPPKIEYKGPSVGK